GMLFHRTQDRKHVRHDIGHGHFIRMAAKADPTPAPAKPLMLQFPRDGLAAANGVAVVRFQPRREACYQQCLSLLAVGLAAWPVSNAAIRPRNGLSCNNTHQPHIKPGHGTVRHAYAPRSPTCFWTEVTWPAGSKVS